MTSDKIKMYLASRFDRRSLSGNELEKRFEELIAKAPSTVKPVFKNPVQHFFEQAVANLFEVRHGASAEEFAGFMSDIPLLLALAPQKEIQRLRPLLPPHKITDNVIHPALGVIQAQAAIAETGTVAINSGLVPSSLLFLCEELLVLLNEDDIVPLQDDLWRHSNPGKYRALHLISGPSRTADVEQTLQVGAHGPRKVYLWVLNTE